MKHQSQRIDNRRLEHLRHEAKHGRISRTHLKEEVIRSCSRMPMVDIFKTMRYELDMIRDHWLRDQTVFLLKKVPRYYWYAPASISSFHDDEVDNGLGGLLRHSCKVVRAARIIAEPYSLMMYTDELVIAAIFHDCLKYGWDGFLPADHDHATYAAAWMEENGFFDDRPRIRNIIRAHLGKWGRVPPTSDLEWGFHLADYFVARGVTPQAIFKPARP